MTAPTSIVPVTMRNTVGANRAIPPCAPSRQSRAPIIIAAPSPLIDRLYRRAPPAIKQAASLRSIIHPYRRFALTPQSQHR